MGSDTTPASIPRDSSDTIEGRGATTTTSSANACDAGGSWGARSDFAVESSAFIGDFADAVNALVRASDVPPIAVSSHMDPGCVWKVTFSAPQASSAWETDHAATFAPMLRHPAGLWTAAPQSSGWLRIVDRASRIVWIPIADVTGSATYGDTTCSSLSAVRVSATIPASAGALRLNTAAGDRSVRDLMGTDPAITGWNVRFTFSADTAR